MGSLILLDTDVYKVFLTLWGKPCSVCWFITLVSMFFTHTHTKILTIRESLTYSITTWWHLVPYIWELWRLTFLVRWRWLYHWIWDNLPNQFHLPFESERSNWSFIILPCLPPSGPAEGESFTFRHFWQIYQVMGWETQTSGSVLPVDGLVTSHLCTAVKQR